MSKAVWRFPHRPHRTKRTMPQLWLLPSRCTASLVSPYSETQPAARNSVQVAGFLKENPFSRSDMAFRRGSLDGGVAIAPSPLPHQTNHGATSAASLLSLIAGSALGAPVRCAHTQSCPPNRFFFPCNAGDFGCADFFGFRRRIGDVPMSRNLGRYRNAGLISAPEYRASCDLIAR